jgi:flavodoxin I
MDIIIVFASMSGKTEFMANCIADTLVKKGHHVDVREAAMTFAEDLRPYETILIGSYTWGDGEIPDEAIDLFEEIENTDLTKKKVAVFGSGDSTYTHFARAVDIWEQALLEQGGKLLTQGLKVDQETEDYVREKCHLFCEQLVGT